MNNGFKVLGMTGSLTFLVWEPSRGSYEIKIEGVKLHNKLKGWEFLEALVSESDAVRPTSGDLWVCNDMGRWMSIKNLLVEFDYADQC